MLALSKVTILSRANSGVELLFPLEEGEEGKGEEGEKGAQGEGKAGKEGQGRGGGGRGGIAVSGDHLEEDGERALDHPGQTRGIAIRGKGGRDRVARNEGHPEQDGKGGTAVWQPA